MQDNHKDDLVPQQYCTL